MPVNQRRQWTVVEIASHAERATSLSELTLPEVKRMAARILDDQRNALGANQTDPKLDVERSRRQVIEGEQAQNSKLHSARSD